ncbi:MAG: bifunctional 4-hydroxy-2-oxoglutarate aldolase/2-dehydro-3-deoxy-phosphogluconate aldolase [Bacteroidales bacterium]
MKSEKRASLVRRIEEAGIVAVIRLTDPRRLHSVMRALADGGVRVFEVTMTVPNALELIREVTPSLPADWLVGAGTVTDAATAQRAICAGAQFIVGPVFRPAVVSACHVHEVPAMPGCFTPTEILSAWETGADVVKVFPATSLGPQFIRDIRAPLPQLKLMPTGGVTLDNAGEWLKAGAVAVGVGSALVDGKAVAADDFATLTANARRLVASVTAARTT